VGQVDRVGSPVIKNKTDGVHSAPAQIFSSYLSSIIPTRFFAGVAIFAGLSSFTVASLQAANFNPGNLVVAVAAASASNTTGSIVELSPSTAAQTALQTVAISGTSYRVSGSGSSTMYMANSADGSLATLTVVKTTDTTSNVNSIGTRGVITINNAATVANPASYTAGTSGGTQTRCASSLDNSTWFIGDQNGFYTGGATAASTSGNFRGVKAFGSTVYAMTSTASAPFVGIISAATGGTYTALAGLPNGATSGQDFYLIQSGSNGTTYDVLYILSATSATAGTIAKYSLVSGTWTANGTYTTTFGGFGLAVKKGSGSTADLFVSSGTGATTANVLYKLTDTAGYNANIAITTGNNVSLYTAATGTIIKGVAFAPVAAPTITGATTAAAFTTTYGTASTAQSFSVSASNLTVDLTATAQTGFEVATTQNGTYGGSVTLTQSSGLASGTVWARLKSNAAPSASAYNGVTAVALTSTGATQANITTAASGNSVSTKALTITGLTGVNKTYDGLTTASATGTAAVSGLVGSDAVTLGGTAVYAFSNATVGTSKSITTSGYTITGGQSSYYTLTQHALTADITARSLTITANNVTKAAGAVLTSGSGSTAFTPSGLQNDETIGTVTITYGSGAPADAAGGVYAGAVVPSAATGGTFTASNYSISYVAGSITVSEAPTITAVGTLSAVSTTYGTDSASPTSFTVSGGNLTGDLSVSAPSGFEVSTNSGSGYATSLTLAQSSGSVSSQTIYVRLAATTGAGSYSGNVSITGGGATAQNLATASSTVATKALTIDLLSAVTKEYDGNDTASMSGTAVYIGLVNGDNFTVSGTPVARFADANVGTAKVVSVLGITAPSLNYSVTQPVLSADITKKALTVGSAAVTTKTYNATTAAVITGSLTGVVGSDAVTFSGTGTFADANAGTGIAVTSTSTISGAQSANYSLTQPTGLKGSIDMANQTITFTNNLTGLPIGSTTALTATASSGLSVSYAVTDTNIATLSGANLVAVARGLTTVVASQAGDLNYNAATPVTNNVSVVRSLTAGDIALIELQTDDNDEFAFVVLSNIDAGTVINFTDNAWDGSLATPALTTNENTIVWTAPVGGVTAGTIVTFQNTVGVGFSVGTYTGAYSGASTSGDQLIAYTGTASNPTFLYALTSNTWISSGSPSTNTSWLPTGLVNGTTARDFSSEIDDQYYSVASISGTKADILASIGNVNNWTRSNTRSTSPISATSISVTQSQTITFTAIPSKTYGDSTFDLTATASSTLPVSYMSSDETVATISGSAVTIKKAGSTTITASQAGNSGYAAATPVQRTLTVNRKAATVTAEAKSKTYGDANPTLTFSTSTLVGSDALSGSLATTATTGSSVGSYQITQGTVSNASNPNYDITYVGADLTVTPSTTTTYNSWLGLATPSDEAFLDYVSGAVTPGTLDPSLRPTVAIVPPTAGSGVDTATLVLTYYVRQNTVGLTVTPKTSADLAAAPVNWVDVIPVDVGVPRDVNGVFVQQKTASVPMIGDRKFLKAEAVQQ